MDELRSALRLFLDERDMGLVRASAYFGLSTATLSKFLNKKSTLNARNLYKIKKGLGLIKEKSK